MLREDPAVGAAWRATRDSLLSARWAWVPGDATDPVSRQLADDANCLFGMGGKPGRMERDWESCLEQMVLYYPTGYRYAELRFHLTPHGIDIADPWVDRLPEAHDRWLWDEGGAWVGVQQKPPFGDTARGMRGGGPVIPATDLVYLAHGVTGSNMEGVGALRPAWESHARRRDVVDLSMDAVEQWAVGIHDLVIDEVGARLAGVSPAELQRQVEQVRSSISARLTGDCAWIESTPYVRIQRLGGDLDPSRTDGLIQSLDASIMRTVLLQWVNLGSTPTGSRSVGEVHRDLWTRSLVQVLDRICAAYSGPHRAGGGVVGRWVALNRPDVQPGQLPRLTHAGLSTDPLIDLLDQLPALTSAGWIRPGRADRDALRQRVTLGPEEEDGL